MIYPFRNPGVDLSNYNDDNYINDTNDDGDDDDFNNGYDDTHYVNTNNDTAITNNDYIDNDDNDNDNSNNIDNEISTILYILTCGMKNQSTSISKTISSKPCKTPTQPFRPYKSRRKHILYNNIWTMVTEENIW